MLNASNFTLINTGTGANYSPTVPISGSQYGIVLSGQDNYDISHQNFSHVGIGVLAQATLQGSTFGHIGFVHHVSVDNAHCGFYYDTNSEYETIESCNVNRCDIGFQMDSGNNTLIGCKATWCTTGFKLTAGDNNAHATFSDCTANHCITALEVNGITLGQTINNCVFIAGQSGQGAIKIINSVGILFNGGQISNIDMTIDATSQVAWRGVTIRGPVNVTLANGGVFDAKGTFVMPGAVLKLNGVTWNGNLG